MPPQAGRRPGNQDTRGAILTAARSAFAARGFAGSSIRGIATDAGVDAALIHHYFESKEALFLATVNIPVDLPGLISHVVESGPDGVGERLVATALDIWESDRGAAVVAAVRTALTDPSMTRSLREFVSFEIIGRVLRAFDISGSEAELRAGLVASQMLGLLVGRYVLELPALVTHPPETLVAAVGPTLQRYFEGDFRLAEGSGIST